MQLGTIQSNCRLYIPKPRSWKYGISTKRGWARVVIDFGPFRFVWYAKRGWSTK